MSISTEISRIQTATNDIKTAITDKGVTVPAGSQIDDLPALITSIPSGGGTIIKKEVTISKASSTSYNVGNYVTNEPFFFVFSGNVNSYTQARYFMYGINGVATGGYVNTRDGSVNTIVAHQTEVNALATNGLSTYYCTYSNGVIRMSEGSVGSTGRLVYYTVQ